MKINQLRKILNSFGDSVYFEHDLKKKNWFKIGGKSKVFFNVSSAFHTLLHAGREGLNHKLRGSNERKKRIYIY